MKRKDTSKLLNEWKSFLNEAESSEINQGQSSEMDFSSYEDPRDVNLDIETILGAMEQEIGLDSTQISAVLDKLSNMPAEKIAAVAEYHNARAFSDEPLEDDKDLSVFER